MTKYPVRHDGFWTSEAIAERIKAEVLDDMQHGIQPRYPADFSALHDRVDANCYGNLCDGDCPLLAHLDDQSALDVINAAQEIVERWLKGRWETRPLWAREHPAADVPERLTADPELVDISWHNDTHPSFTTKAVSALETSGIVDIRLWVNYAKIEDREIPEIARYAVIDHNLIDPHSCLFESEDDLGGAISALKAATVNALKGR